MKRNPDGSQTSTQAERDAEAVKVEKRIREQNADPRIEAKMDEPHIKRYIANIRSGAIHIGP